MSNITACAIMKVKYFYMQAKNRPKYTLYDCPLVGEDLPLAGILVPIGTGQRNPYSRREG